MVDNKIINVFVTLLLVFSGVGIYQGSVWLSHNQISDFVLEMNESVAVYKNVNDDTRVDIIQKNDKCPGGYIKVEVEDDVTQIKCGSRIHYEFKTYVGYEKTYGLDENLTHERKRKTIQIKPINKTYDCSYSEIIKGINTTIPKTCVMENHVEVIKSLDYYKGEQRITGGSLSEIYIVTPNKIKLNYDWNPLYTRDKSIIRLCFSRFDDSVLKFDGIEEYMVRDGCYYYGYEKGRLLVDPSFSKGTSNLISYFTHDDSNTSGSISIGYNNTGNGTIVGATTGVSGKINEAYDFDGSNDYIDLNFLDSIPTGTDYTYAAWIKINELVDNHFIINTKLGHIRYLNVLGGINCLHSQSENGASTWDKIGPVTDDLSIDTWYHIACVFNTTTNRLTLYINGTNVTNSQTTEGGSAIFLNAEIGANGRSNGVRSSFFNGSIDEVGVWSIALNSTDIEYLYASGSPGSAQQPPFPQPAANNSANVTLNSPVNNTLFNTSLITLNYTYTDPEGDPGSCSLFINDIVNVTNTSISNNTDVINTLVLSNGNYNWSANCTDGGNITNSSTLFFNITVPSIKNINITLNPGTLFNFTPNGTNSSELNVAAQGQNDTTSLISVCNNESVVVDVFMNDNGESTLYTMKCNNSNNPVDAINLNVTNQTIISNLSISSCDNVWCWVDYNGTRYVETGEVEVFGFG